MDLKFGSRFLVYLKNTGNKKIFFFAIGSSVRIPFCVDQFTNKPKFDREFRHIVRILVDIDLRKTSVYRVQVERTGFAFFVDIDYENMLEFCNLCNDIRHSQSKCSKLNAGAKKYQQKKLPNKLFKL